MEKIRVVLVDDETAVVEMMTLQLEEDDRIQLVGTGHNGREALRLANALRPDVIVLDITMPQLNGLEASARITSAFPSIAVIIATANQGEQFVREALRSGAKDFLDKPIAANVLVEAIVRANGMRDRSAPARGFASVWAYYGSKASSGCTTLAVNTVLDLATMGYRALLIDLDVNSGDCARYLGQTRVEDGPDLFTRLAQAGEVTADTVKPLIRRVVMPVTPELAIDTLMTPGQFTAPGPRAADALRELLDRVVPMYDYIIVDLPPGRLFDPQVGLVLDYAERFFLLANTDVSSLAAVQAVAATLATTEWSFDRLSLVLSGLIVQSQLSVRSWLVERKVPLRELLQMPVDTRACSWAVQRGVPVLLSDPGSPYASFVHTVVDHALNRPPITGSRTTLWQRLKGLLHY